MKTVLIIGGGPAGLMAAERLSAQGILTAVYDRKPSVGRKFLMAGRGGLNLTHSENLEKFIARYGAQGQILAPLIQAFPPDALRMWCEGLGEETFVGSSGRVFPKSFKASPLLREWIARLEKQGVVFHLNHDWQGWDGDVCLFQTPGGAKRVQADAVLLALGGASWPRLGSDGSWVKILQKDNVNVSPLKPANCGFGVQWSDFFKNKFAGHPIKSITATAGDQRAQGEMIITLQGLEGGVIYALSRALRDGAPLHIDLKPDLDVEAVTMRLAKSRGRESLSNHLRRTLGLSPAAIGLLMECPDRVQLGQYDAGKLATLIKNYPVSVTEPLGIERAISTTGGVSFDALDENLMLRVRPGVFLAGEMLDWEAPTGGYLLQASFATGVHAAQGIMKWLKH